MSMHLDHLRPRSSIVDAGLYSQRDIERLARRMDKLEAIARGMPFAGAQSAAIARGGRSVAGPPGGGGGGADPYSYYPALDKATLPFHTAAGGWGAQNTLKEAAAPVITSTGTAGNTTQLAAALYTPGVRVTLTDDIPPAFYFANNITDVEVVIPSGAVLDTPFLGAGNGSRLVQRVRFRGSTLGDYSTGGRLHQLGAYAPIADISVIGLKLSAPGDNAKCIAIERLNFSSLCARLAVHNCAGHSGSNIYFGDMGDSTWTNCAFLTGSDTTILNEAWGHRFDVRTGGNTVMFHVDCRSDTIRTTSAHNRVRICPHASADPYYSYFEECMFVELVESKILWPSSQSGNSGTDAGNLRGLWFLNNEVIARSTGPEGLPATMSLRDAVYARCTGNRFRSDTITSAANITSTGGGSAETDPTDVVKTPNTFEAPPGVIPGWQYGPGDPSSIPITGL